MRTTVLALALAVTVLAAVSVGAETRPVHPYRVRTGDATIETYTVLFDREGAPERGVVVGRTPGGRRFFANTPDDRRLLDAMTKREMVGAGGVVATGADGRNIFTPS